jgi:hypothetical protein
MSDKEKIYWFADSKIDNKYQRTTWFRCMGITQFIREVEKNNKIVALIIPDGEDDRNNIGFILDDKPRRTE